MKRKTLQLVAVRWWNASAYYGVSLAKALNEYSQQTEAVVAGRADSPPLQKAMAWGVPSFTEQLNLESQNPVQIWRNLQQLRYFIQQNNITLLNAHRSQDLLHAALLKKFYFPKIPLIRTISDVRSPKNNAINYWLHHKMTDYFIFSCQKSYERYQAVWPIFEGKSTVIYNAIDTDFFHPTKGDGAKFRQQYAIATDELLIGMIGRLSAVKGHSVFLKAAAKVVHTAQKLRFVISGEECDVRFEDLQKMAREWGIPKENLLLLPRQKEVRDMIQAFDIAVITSTDSEVVNRVGAEYMATSKAHITSNVNVLGEMVKDGVNGLVVPPNDAEALANALVSLINQPALRQKLGDAARQCMETKHTYAFFAQQTEEVYGRLDVRYKT